MRALNIVNLVFTVLSVVVWAGVTWMGADQGIASRYYVQFPAVILGCALTAGAMAFFTKYKRTALTLQIVVLIAVLPFLFYYTGGI